MKDSVTLEAEKQIRNFRIDFFFFKPVLLPVTEVSESDFEMLG